MRGLLAVRLLDGPEFPPVGDAASSQVLLFSLLLCGLQHGTGHGFAHRAGGRSGQYLEALAAFESRHADHFGLVVQALVVGFQDGADVGPLVLCLASLSFLL